MQLLECNFIREKACIIINIDKNFFLGITLYRNKKLSRTLYPAPTFYKVNLFEGNHVVEILTVKRFRLIKTQAN